MALLFLEGITPIALPPMSVRFSLGSFFSFLFCFFLFVLFVARVQTQCQCTTQAAYLKKVSCPSPLFTSIMAAARSAVTLRIVQITDVYRLHFFPNVKNLLIDKKKEEGEYTLGTGGTMDPILIPISITLMVLPVIFCAIMIILIVVESIPNLLPYTVLFLFFFIWRYYQDYLRAHWRLSCSLSAVLHWQGEEYDHYVEWDSHWLFDIWQSWRWPSSQIRLPANKVRIYIEMYLYIQTRIDMLYNIYTYVHMCAHLET